MVRSGTLILNAAARLLLPLQLLFSVFLLLRGHDEPGGGFIAGLVASSPSRSTSFPRDGMRWGKC